MKKILRFIFFLAITATFAQNGTPPTDSLKKNTFAEDMYMSPNPATNFVTFSNLQHMRVAQIDVFSALGNLSKSAIVQNNTGNALRMDISNLKSGVYIVRFIDVSGISTKRKLIVN
jgi:hypothetical protein